MAAALAVLTVLCGLALLLIEYITSHGPMIEIERGRFIKYGYSLDTASALEFVLLGMGILFLLACRKRWVIACTVLAMVICSLAVLFPFVWLTLIVKCGLVGMGEHDPVSPNSAVGACLVGASLLYLCLKRQASRIIPRLAAALICGIGTMQMIRYLMLPDPVLSLGPRVPTHEDVLLLDSIASLCLGAATIFLVPLQFEINDPRPLWKRIPAVWPTLIVVSFIVARSMVNAERGRLHMATFREVGNTVRIIDGRVRSVLACLDEMTRRSGGQAHQHGPDCPLNALEWFDCQRILKPPGTVSINSLHHPPPGAQAVFGSLTRKPDDRSTLYFIPPPGSTTDQDSTALISLNSARFAFALVDRISYLTEFDIRLQVIGIGEVGAPRMAGALPRDGWLRRNLETGGLMMSLNVRPSVTFMDQEHNPTPAVVVVGAFLLAALVDVLAKTTSHARQQIESGRERDGQLATAIGAPATPDRQTERSDTFLPGDHDSNASKPSRVTIESLMATVAQSVSDCESPALCAVYLLDEESRQMRCVGSPDADRELVQFIKDQLTGTQGGPVADLTGKADHVVCTDLTSDQRWKHLQKPARKAGVRACGAVPIRLPSSQLVGVLALFDSSPTPLSPIRLAQLQTVARLTGIVVDRYRAAAQSDRAAGELRRMNLESEDFVYAVSHDLKAPLVTVAGYTGFLKQRMSQSGDRTVAQWADRIDDGVAHMRRLVDDLLTLGRLGHTSIDLRPVDLRQTALVVLRQLEPLTRQTGASISLAQDMPVVLGDADRIFQIFQNLTENALRHGRPESGQPHIEIGAQQSADGTRIFVRDDGPGIDPQFHDTIFQVFERVGAQREGTGIGLSIVKRAAELHGGRAWVESSPGKGACFSVFLPYPHDHQPPVIFDHSEATP